MANYPHTARRRRSSLLNLLTGQRAKTPPGVAAGDTVTVDMKVIRRQQPRFGFGGKHWLQVVRDTVKMGDGTVLVESVSGNTAEIVGHAGAAFLGSASVPLSALRKVGRRGRANDLTEWIVTLRRVDVNYTKVVVQAKDWDDAAEQAEERVWTDRSIQWELQDPRGTDLEVIDAEEV